MKLLASSATKQGLEKMINQYFFSSSYRLSDDSTIKSTAGNILQGYCWKIKKSRYYFYLSETTL